MALEQCTLGGGCFWCLDAVFRSVRGVLSVVSGYSGGQTPNPSYREVCSGKTGHAEVVQIRFENEEISFDSILNIFFSIHDPTSLNRQGADIGTQYRSVVFYESDGQAETARFVIGRLVEEDIWGKAIVTEVSPLQGFYPAEEYHQNYHAMNPGEGYCQAVISPKLLKFRKNYLDFLA